MWRGQFQASTSFTFIPFLISKNLNLTLEDRKFSFANVPRLFHLPHLFPFSHLIKQLQLFCLFSEYHQWYTTSWWDLDYKKWETAVELRYWVMKTLQPDFLDFRKKLIYIFMLTKQLTNSKCFFEVISCIFPLRWLSQLHLLKRSCTTCRKIPRYQNTNALNGYWCKL